MRVVPKCVLYLFNQLGTKGSDTNTRGNLAVAIAENELVGRGYVPIEGKYHQVEASIDGMPVRRYDLVMMSPDGVLTGIEVKSTIFSAFKLDGQQVRFDVQVYANGIGAGSSAGFIKEVLYYGVQFGGDTAAAFKTGRLATALREAGVETVGKQLPPLQK